MADEVDTTITDAIADLAVAPKKTDVDGLSVEEHPLPDLIKADQYKKAVAMGSASGWGACRPARLVPPGSIGPKATE